jgi:hypothetical protein
MENLTIHGISTDGPAYCEAIGLSKVFKAYAENCCNEEIMYGGLGFNPNSGNVYLALENGITLFSMLGQDVMYVVTNFDNGEEFFFYSYKEAFNFDINDKNYINEY